MHNTLCWLALAWGSAAAAQPVDQLAQARAAERAGDPAAEASLCQTIVDEPTNDRAVAVCAARLKRLDARRDSVGTWASLEQMEQIRRGASGLDPTSARIEVEQIARRESTSQVVRDDAALWLAREALDHSNEPQRALQWTTPLWSRLTDQPDDALRRQVAGLHARALERAGRSDEAAEVDATLAPIQSQRPRDGRTRERQQAYQTALRRGAWATLVVGGAALGVVGLRGASMIRRRRPRPWGLAPLGVMGAGTAAVVAARDPTALPGLLLLLAALAAVHLAAAAALVGAPAGWRRGLTRAVVGIVTLAAAALVLDYAGLMAALVG